VLPSVCSAALNSAAPPSKNTHLQISFSKQRQRPSPGWSSRHFLESRKLASKITPCAEGDSAGHERQRVLVRPIARTTSARLPPSFPSLLNSRGKGPTDETEEQFGWVLSRTRPPVEPTEAALVVVNCVDFIRAITRTTSRTPLFTASDSKDSHRGPY
jgi:hypothetical protein